MYVCYLGESLAEDISIVGTKTYYLNLLKRYGYNVPQCFCITANALQSYIKENGLAFFESVYQIGEWEQFNELSKSIRAGEFSKKMEEEFRQHCTELAHSEDGSWQLVCRSSSPIEYLTIASAAGQFDTVLGIRSWKEMKNAIRSCWTSIMGKGLQKYFMLLGIEAQPDQCPLIVQRMISSTKAGVVFSPPHCSL